MDVTSSYETPVLTRTARRPISEDGILHSHRSENLKYYKMFMSILILRIDIIVGIICLKSLNISTINITRIFLLIGKNVSTEGNVTATCSYRRTFKASMIEEK
jgi:hypothetical protein